MVRPIRLMQFDKPSFVLLLSALSALLFATHVQSTDLITTRNRPADQHYTEVGFFDVHYCHWSDRPKFYLILFSTERYQEIAKIETFAPDGKFLKNMDLNRYKLIEKKGRPVKRVFVLEVPSHIAAKPGWFSATIIMKDGSTHHARDFVYITTMPLATNIVPRNGSENIPVPRRLIWDAVPGAKYYKVFVSDLWDDGRVVFDSGLLRTPYVDLPAGLIKKSGWYQWNIHARDVNEHVLFGDFNHGSNLVGLQFTTDEQ